MDIFYPLQKFADWLVYNVFNLESTSRLGGSINFFVYDSLKIFLLLFVITIFMSWLRFYLPIEKLRDFLLKHKFYGLDYFLASLFGALTPFCSCSSIPLFIGFVGAGIPLGVTFAFLITSPLINEVAVALFIGIFGVKITIIYVVAGMLVGMVGGYILGKMKGEKYVEEFVFQTQVKTGIEKNKKINKQIIKNIFVEAWCIIKKVALYILLGLAIGAVIHGYIPENFFAIYLERAGFWGVPLAVILGVPMYANAAGVIPIVQALIEKGVPIGTAMAFMMAVVGLSLPEGVMLKKVLQWPLLLSFFGVVTLGIIIIGFLFNIIL